MRDVNARLAAPLRARQRRELLLHRRLHPHLPRPLLRLVQGAARDGVDARRSSSILLMMATAFMGYVLPWGQMSFWGAQVITGFFSAIPLVGEPVRHVAARRLRPRPGDAQPLLLAALSAAVRDRWVSSSSTSGRCTSRVRQPDRRRRQGRTGHRPVPPLLHREGRLRRRRVPDSSLRCRVLPPERARPRRQLYPGQLRSRRRRISSPNGISGPSTRSCAPSRWTSSWPPRSCGACWRCSPRSLLLFFLPWLDRSPVRRATTGRSSASSSGSWSPTCLVLGWCGGAAGGTALRDAQPDRRDLLFRPFPDHPADRLADRTAAAVPNSISEAVLRGEKHATDTASASATADAADVIGTDNAHGSPPLGFLVGLGFVAVPRCRSSRRGAYFHEPLAMKMPSTSSTSSPRHLKLASDGTVRRNWTRQQLQRGFQVYKEVCAACHGLQPRRVPRPRGPRLHRGAEIKAVADKWPIEVPGRSETGEASTRKALPADYSPDPLSERDRRPRRQQQRASARPVADHQGARRRPGLCRVASDRLPEPARQFAAGFSARPEPSFQSLIRQSQHRHAAAAPRRPGHLCRRHQADGRPDGEGRHRLPRLDGRAEARESPRRRAWRF